MMGCLWGGIRFLSGIDIFSRNIPYYVAYPEINGIQTATPVTIQGVKVGTVTGIGFNPSVSRSVVLQLTVRRTFRIPSDSEARIYSDGLMGGKAVELELGKSAKYLQQGDTLFSEINKDFLEVAGSEFEFLKQRANDVINQLMITLGHINTLMADNKDNLNATFTNIASISGNLNEVIAGEKNNVREIVQNLNELSKTLSSKSGQIDRIVTNVENFSDSLSKSKIPTMIAQATTTLESLNTTLEKVNHGDGTVGRFLNDQALYDELVDATANLSALLEDLKAHPSRYINVSVFGRRNRDE